MADTQHDTESEPQHLTTADEPQQHAETEPQPAHETQSVPSPHAENNATGEPADPPAQETADPPAQESAFDVEANELEKELALLNSECDDYDKQVNAADSELKDRDALEEALKAKQEHLNERQVVRQQMHDTTADLEHRAKTRDGTDHEMKQAASIEQHLGSARFANLWRVTVATDNLDELTRAAPEDGMDPADVHNALVNVTTEHEKQEYRADAILSDAAAAKAAHAEKNTAIRADLESDLKNDLKRLAAMKPRLREALYEQRFHLKRGTHIKGPTVVRRGKDEFLQLEQAKRENDKYAELIQEEERLTSLSKAEIDTLKREKQQLLETCAVEKAALLQNIDMLSQEVEVVAWEQKTLESENQSLRELRRDVIRTETQVRHQLRQ